MGRYRPPAPRSSPYITRSGYHALLKEQKEIWQRRKIVTEAVSAAAAEGDRSENAEYIYRKKQLRELDRRIRYLQKRIPDLKIVEKVGRRDRVFFGATVGLEDQQGQQLVYRIVGADEIDPDSGNISIDSPVAKAILKKELDDEFSVRLGDREESFTIISINYDQLDEERL